MQSQLRTLRSDPSGAIDIDLVLIPGLGTPPVEQWGVVGLKWWIPEGAPNTKVRFVTYDYQIPVDHKFQWETLLAEGEKLLEALIDDRKGHENENRPLMFMCHSLGGIILKKEALSDANVQSYGGYNLSKTQIISVVSGIVFLGTPHTKAVDEPNARQTYSQIVRFFNSSISKQTLSKIEDNLSVLGDVCRLFEDIRFRVLVASVYETRPMRLRRTFRQDKQRILVDHQLSRTNAVREELFALAADHASLCKLDRSEGQDNMKFEERLRSMLERSGGIVQARLSEVQWDSSPSTSRASSDRAQVVIEVVQTIVASEEPHSTEVEQAETQIQTQTQTSTSEKDWEILPLLDSFSKTRRVARLPCFMVEDVSRNKEFFGRKDVLEELDEYLLPADKIFSSQATPQRHAVLYGLGGLGKTEIAIEFAFSRRDFFDAVFWIRADEPGKLEADFSKISATLGLDNPNEPQNPVISRELAKGWLASPRKVLNENTDVVGQGEATWLIIFDNADHPSLLTDYWPLLGAGSVLITSRDPIAKTSPSVAPLSIDLKEFQQEEAAEFFRQLTRNDKERESSLQIAQRLGGHPLALVQMAGFIVFEYIPFKEFLETYDENSQRKELHQYTAQNFPSGARGNLSSLFAVSQLSEDAKELLELIALLDPDSIQESIVKVDSENTAVSTKFPRKHAYTLARSELLKRSLIARTDDGKGFRIHRVPQDAVRAKMDTTRFNLVFQSAVLLILKLWGATTLDKRHSVRYWKEREALFPHVLSLKLLYVQMTKESEMAADANFAHLLQEAGWWQHERGNSHATIDLLHIALSISERIPEQTFDLRSDCHYGLGGVGNETNDGRGCLEHNKILLEMRQQAFEKSQTPDLRLAVAYNQIATGWMMSGNFEAAIDACKNSIRVYRSLPEYWKCMESLPTVNLGVAYWLKSDLDNASRTVEEGLRDREEKYGVMDQDSFRTGRFLHTLGNIRWSQERWVESEDFHRRALKQYQSTIGNNHHRTADVCHRVAQHCIRGADFHNANTFVEQALNVWQANANIYAPELARTTFLKAVAWRGMGREEAEVEKLVQDAVTFTESVRDRSLRGKKDLKETDFDDLVTFWSK